MKLVGYFVNIIQRIFVLNLSQMSGNISFTVVLYNSDIDLCIVNDYRQRNQYCPVYGLYDGVKTVLR